MIFEWEINSEIWKDLKGIENFVASMKDSDNFETRGELHNLYEME